MNIHEEVAAWRERGPAPGGAFGCGGWRRRLLSTRLQQRLSAAA